MSKDTKKKKNPLLGFLKWFLIVFLILASGLAGTIAYFYYTTDPQELVKIISAEVMLRYNREIKVEGISISIFEGVHLNGIELSRTGGFQYGVSVSFKEGSLIYNPLALLARELDILSITVSGLYTTFDNSMAILDDFLKSPPPSKTTNAQKSLFIFKIHAIELKDSQLLINDVPLNFHVIFNPSDTLSNAGLMMEAESMFGSLRYDGTIGKGYLTVRDFEPDKIFKLSTGIQIPRLEAELSMENVESVAITGKIVNIKWKDFMFSSKTQFKGNYSIKNKYVLVHNLGFRINGSDFFVTRFMMSFARVKIDALIDKIDVRISDFFKDMDGHLTGKVDLIYEKTFDLNGEFELADFRFQWIEKLDGKIVVRNSELSGNASAVFSGGTASLQFSSPDIVKSPWTISLDSEKIDLVKFLAEWEKYSGSGGGGEGSGAPAIAPPVFNIRADIGQLVFGDVDLRSISASGVFKDFQLTADGTLYFLRGKLTAHLGWKGDTVSGNFKYSDGKLKEFADAFLKGQGMLHGTINAQGTFALDMRDLFNSDADFTVQASGGEIRDFPVQKEMASALYGVPVDDLFFDNIALSASLKNKELTVKGFQFDSDAIVIHAAGSIFTDSKKMNIGAEASFSKDFLYSLPNITTLFTYGYEQGERVVFKLAIGGMFDKPSATLK